MITRQELKELALHKIENAFFISLYLNVDPANIQKDGWLLHFKNMSRDALNKLKSRDKTRVQKDMELIEGYLADRPEGMKRGLVIFSCAEKPFWREYHSQLPFTNQLIVDHNIFLKPLAVLTDLYQRYLVAVVGKTTARILLTSIGEIEELTNIITEMSEPDTAKDGRIGDMAELRAERQRDKIKRIVHRDAMKVVESILAEEKIKRILVGGTDRNRAHFKEIMPQPLREKVVGEFAVDKRANNREILEKLMPVMHEIEYNFERKALDELFNQSTGTVLGLSDVLTALQQGNVHKMYVLSSVTTPGMVCKRCGALTPERDRNCPYCASEMKRVPYMLDLAIQKAMDQGARVDMLDEAPRLDVAGGIGALLRY